MSETAQRTVADTGADYARVMRLLSRKAASARSDEKFGRRHLAKRLKEQSRKLHAIAMWLEAEAEDGREFTDPPECLKYGQALSTKDLDDYLGNMRATVNNMGPDLLAQVLAYLHDRAVAGKFFRLDQEARR